MDMCMCYYILHGHTQKLQDALAFYFFMSQLCGGPYASLNLSISSKADFYKLKDTCVFTVTWFLHS